MALDTLSKPEHIEQLRTEMSDLYQDNEFLTCLSMGDLVRTSLRMLEKYPVRKRIPLKVKRYA
jgi:hypothetical protein